MNRTKNLSEIPLQDLHILKSHAMLMLDKAQRLMGNIDRGMMDTFEAKEFHTVSAIYKIFEDEMWSRIKQTAIGE
jgi:hypothetical protein